MNTEELLRDLKQRCEQAEANLKIQEGQAAEAAGQAGTYSLEATRLKGKAEGIAVVRDWLESYE